MAAYCLHCMEPFNGRYPCPHCGILLKPTNAPHQLLPGTLLKDHLLIGRALGQGGFGITYIGRDLTLDTRIAVKEYYLSNCSSRVSQASQTVTVTGKDKEEIFARCKRRFLDEARILEHYRREKGIVNVRDYFEDNGTAYIVMEYLDGETLQSRIRRGPLPAIWVFRSFEPMMDALARMHEDTVIHRDISPDNIMLLKDGSLCLMDFGSARHMPNDRNGNVTILHKSGYAPIEQYNGSLNLGPWTDIYALCATMYTCITGRRPSASIARPAGRIAWPSELGIPITAAQEAVLQRGMAIDPASRFQSISDMREALRIQPAVNVHRQASRQTVPRNDSTPSRLPKGISYCPKCGRQVIRGSKCSHCEENKRRTAIIIALAGLLAILIGALCAILIWTADSGIPGNHISSSSARSSHSSSTTTSSNNENASYADSDSTLHELYDQESSVTMPSSNSNSRYYEEDDLENEDEDSWNTDGSNDDDGVADAYVWIRN